MFCYVIVKSFSIFSDDTLVLNEDVDDSMNVPDSWDTPLGTFFEFM